MNTYYLKDVKSLDFYKTFLKQNTGLGTLKIRAFAASEAMPIKNLFISVSKVINDKTIIFYEGYTNDSGTIDNIILPTPKISLDNDLKPDSTTYIIKVKYLNKDYSSYIVSIYENVMVIQNINIVPGEYNGY